MNLPPFDDPAIIPLMMESASFCGPGAQARLKSGSKDRQRLLPAKLRSCLSCEVLTAVEVMVYVVHRDRSADRMRGIGGNGIPSDCCCYVDVKGRWSERDTIGQPVIRPK